MIIRTDTETVIEKRAAGRSCHTVSHININTSTISVKNEPIAANMKLIRDSLRYFRCTVKM